MRADVGLWPHHVVFASFDDVLGYTAQGQSDRRFFGSRDLRRALQCLPMLIEVNTARGKMSELASKLEEHSNGDRRK